MLPVCLGLLYAFLMLFLFLFIKIKKKNHKQLKKILYIYAQQTILGHYILILGRSKTCS
jgi:hypothetical protein